MRRKQFTYKGYNIYILVDDTSWDKRITIKKGNNIIYKNILNLKHMSDAASHAKRQVNKFAKK